MVSGQEFAGNDDTERRLPVHACDHQQIFKRRHGLVWNITLSTLCATQYVATRAFPELVGRKYLATGICSRFVALLLRSARTDRYPSDAND
jgi:hypothetical protein